MNTIRKAVIPAAGFGTRLLPATKAVPKELLPVIDKPVLQYVVEEAVASGITELIVITSAGKGALADHLLDHAALEAHLRQSGKVDLLDKVHDITRGARVRFIEQPEQRGLGDAVRCGREAVGDEPFAVLLGDTIIHPDDDAAPGLRQIIDVYDRMRTSVVAVRRIQREHVNRYGIVDGQPVDADERTYRLDRLIEKPTPDAAPTNLAIAGRYVFTPAIFEPLAAAQPGHGGEIQLTDAMNALAATEGMHAHLWRATRYDLGNRTDYMQCLIEMIRRDRELGSLLR